MALEEFDYEIEHRSGERMKHVDALSRNPVFIIENDTITVRLQKAQTEDENICTIKTLLNDNKTSEFCERNGILYKYVNNRELIVAPKGMQTELIKLAHEKGHFSTAKTEDVIKQEFLFRI